MCLRRRDDAIATSSDGKVGVDACAKDAINNMGCFDSTLESSNTDIFATV